MVEVTACVVGLLEGPSKCDGVTRSFFPDECDRIPFHSNHIPQSRHLFRLDYSPTRPWSIDILCVVVERGRVRGVSESLRGEGEIGTWRK